MGPIESALASQSIGIESEHSSAEYPITGILDETHDKYLVAWEGNYEPSWEPKHFVNEAAVHAWESKKNNRNLAADRYRGERPLRSCQATRINLLSQSSLASVRSGTNTGSQYSQSSGSVFVPQFTKQAVLSTLSQSTASSGSLFVPSSYQATQSAGAFSSQSQSLALEILETPASRLQITESQKNHSPQRVQLFASQINPSIPLSNKPDNSSIWNTPECRPLDPDRSAIQTIPETVNHREFLSSPGSIEDSPSVFVSFNSRGTNCPLIRPEEASEEQARLPESSENSFFSMEDSSNNNPSYPMATGTVDNSPGSAFFKKMRHLRAAERASVKPLQSLTGSATPSSAGDIEPSGPSAASEGVAPLSVRHDKPVMVDHGTESPVPFVAPQALHYNPDQPALLGEAGAKLAESSGLSPPATLELVAQQFEQEVAQKDRSTEEHKGIHLGPFEFAVPLSMDSRVKDDYDRTLHDASKSIRKFVACPPAELTGAADSEFEILVAQMKRMIDQLDNISSHPDLNLTEQPSSGSLDVEKEASWAEYSSSKFQFLGYFMDAVLEDPLDRAVHIIIMAKAGPTVDILRKYFLGKQLADISASPQNSTPFIFTLRHFSVELRTTQDHSAAPLFKEPAMVVALDSSFDADDPSVLQLRTLPLSNHLVPVIRLIISNTAEHVALCLPRSSDLERLRTLVECTQYHSSVAGDLQDDALGVQENAEETLRYLMSDPETREWPLADVAVIEVLTLNKASSLEPDILRTMSVSRQKRWLDEGDDDANSSKRQRMTPFQDITHISDSVKGQTQGSQGAGRATERDSDAIAEIIELQSALADARTRLQAMEVSFGRLQHRYESKHELYHKTRRELSQALDSGKKSEARVQKQKEEISKLQDEKVELINELNELRVTLKTGGGLPAELEIAKEEIRKLSQEKSNLERQSQQERSQSEFTRQQYQNASTAAAQSGTEIRQLKDQLEELKRKSSGEASKLKELQTKNAATRHLQRVEELEGLLASREKLLTMKEDEIRELRKNRPNTRSTSTQPRSPKFAGSSRPVSPAPNSNSNNIGRGSVLRFRVEP